MPRKGLGAGFVCSAGLFMRSSLRICEEPANLRNVIYHGRSGRNIIRAQRRIPLLFDS
jgi:hypothetical protein